MLLPMEQDRTPRHMMSMLCNKYGKIEMDGEKQMEKRGDRGNKRWGERVRETWRNTGKWRRDSCREEER